VPILLFFVFIVVPVIELAVILQVRDVIGLPATLVTLVLVSVLGSWLVRREGMRAWNAFRKALRLGRPPTTEVVDGALVLFGGALLLTPGFVTDLLGLSLIFPPTRALVNRAIRRRVRTQALGGFAGTGAPGSVRRGPSAPRRGATRADTEVEVIDVRRSQDGDSPRR
jgi:UPF0716 protein FxsA